MASNDQQQYIPPSTPQYAPTTPNYGYQQPDPSQNNYDFIMNSGTPPPQKSNPFNGASAAIRIGIVGAGLVVLLIVFMLFRSVFFGSNLTPFVSVLQSQQEVVRLTTNAQSLEDLSVENEYFAITTRMAVSSSQAAVLDYMTLNKQKIGEKQIALKTNLKTDETLKVAASAGTLDSTFREVMIEQLEEYRTSLSTAYDTTKGKRGHTLLENDYKQVDLLLGQLKSAQEDTN